MSNKIFFDLNLFQMYSSDGTHKYYHLDSTKKIGGLKGSCFVKVKQKTVEGTKEGNFYFSPSGYLYSHEPKIVTWIKFFTLGTTLPFRALAAKISFTVKKVFCGTESTSGLHNLSHSFVLTSISWKAVLGLGNYSLTQRVEQFALQELTHNGGCTQLLLPRSERFQKGFYAARCMQPLFHQSQLSSESKKCDFYVRKALERQQPSIPWCRPDVQECTFCAFPCCRSERQCGCVYKIDCCAQRCYALDLFFCFCCIWPEGETAFIVI